MKNLKILAYVFVVIYLSGCEKKPTSFLETKEERQARYNKILSCKPDKPLSKGELYEKAMVQYWQHKTNSAFNADADAYETELEKPEEYRRNLRGDEYKEACSLTYHKDGTPDKVTNDVCYPYQVYQFDDLKDFSFGDDKEYKNKNLTDFIVNNKAQVYRWDKQPPIYKAENYNKDVDFMVRQSVRNVNIYPKDCCKLFSYEEIINQQNSGKFYFSKWDKDIAPMNTLTGYNFLTIKNLYNVFDNKRYETTYWLIPITECGDILTY